MTCTGNVDSYGIEQRSASGAFEEWGPTGLSGSWQRGPFSAGTPKMYCTYYYVGGAKSHAGACIKVTWRPVNPPQITSFTSSCSTCHGQYTLSWTTQYADSCTLNGRSVPVNGSQRESTPRDECYTDSDCGRGQDYKCAGVTESVTYTLTCSNSAGSRSQSLTVTERWNECRPPGGRPPFPRQ
jgi:hypothetical protein